MIELKSSTLGQLGPDVRLPGYDRTKLRGGIVHIGVGNFHRIHQAYYVDQCLHRPGNEAWGIVGVGLTDGRGVPRQGRRLPRSGQPLQHHRVWPGRRGTRARHRRHDRLPARPVRSGSRAGAPGPSGHPDRHAHHYRGRL